MVSTSFLKRLRKAVFRPLERLKLSPILTPQKKLSTPVVIHVHIFKSYIRPKPVNNWYCVGYILGFVLKGLKIVKLGFSPSVFLFFFGNIPLLA